MPSFSPRTILISTIVLCVIAISVYIWFFSHNGYDSTPEGWGQLGDYVGGVVGTIVATSTVIFLVLTLNAQNKTKNDNFFFYLLQIKDRHVAALDVRLRGQRYEGNHVLRELVIGCRLIHHHYSENPDKVRELLSSAKPSLIAYLSHNEEIINFISSTSNDITKYHSVNYKNIYLAQLSNEEKIILGYYCALLPDEVMTIKKFYVESKIKDLVEYEPHLAESRTQKPDAIKEIIDSIKEK